MENKETPRDNLKPNSGKDASWVDVSMRYSKCLRFDIVILNAVEMPV